MTDAELTAAYTEYADMVYRIAYVQTKSLAQAEDIQQDVFMALVRYSDRIRSEQHLKAWLIRVTQNACKKHFRSLWFKLHVPYDDALFKETEEEGGALPEPDAQEEDREDIELVQDMVEELPESYRIVVHLFYYEQMPIREIASAIGVTEQNVKTRLSRARDRLRKLWEERR
ncbi:MAG: sigma-70 family RNA polymerase sigma factor [Clostridia bacterium]|nr:sigma-70 family RNA polymerase sigma factor [Clostridia bacterium]